MRIIKYDINKILKKELQKSYKYFIRECNNSKKSNGYGLIRDKSHYDKEIASIACVGFGLAALIIGVENKWISYEKAFNKAVKTLDTFINNVEGTNGFFYHFVDMNTGKRQWNCELSIIDTAIIICGAPPCKADLNIENAGTVANYGSVGSIIFTSNITTNAKLYISVISNNL